MKKKIAIVGSRSITDYQHVLEFITAIIFTGDIEEIISGGANGIDKVAEQIAALHDIKMTVYKPDWKQYGKCAGVIRNKTIIENADIVFAIWDGNSNGTHNSIDIAHDLNKELYIDIYNK